MNQSPGAGPLPLPRLSNQTLRQIIHASTGGDRIRVVLSNAFGTGPLVVGAARVALRGPESASVPSSEHALTFGGRAPVTIPAGAVVVSDPTPLRVPAQADLIIDLYLPGDVAGSARVLTMHAGAQQTGFISREGNHAGARSFPVESVTTSWFFLARVEAAASPTATVVVLGDSITDGARSSVDTNNRWPDHLARLAAERGLRLGMINAGLAGNRVLEDGNGPNALARFDRDVLAHPGVTHLVVMHGINDIGRGASAEDLIAAYEQVIERARSHGLRVIGVTLTPIEDATFEGYYTAAHEAVRQRVNEWIRTGRGYDGIIDADAALRDPARPTRLRTEYASPDFIHPNDRGYRAIAEAVDFRLFTGAAVSAASR